MKTVMSNGIAIFVAAVMLLAASSHGSAHAGFAPETKTLFTKHFENTLFGITGHAAYSVEVLLDDKEYKIGKNVVGIIVHNAYDEDVAGAEITFILRDLASGKANAVTPEVTDRRNGLYVVSGLDMLGEERRELTITIKKGRAEDSLKFVLPDALKERLPKGAYSP